MKQSQHVDSKDRWDCQSSKVSTSSVTYASGASGATLIQPKLHHNAVDNAATEHQCTSDSDVAQLKRIKSFIDMSKLQNRDVA